MKVDWALIIFKKPLETVESVSVIVSKFVEMR
jgi:hypothetical protein